MREERLTPIGCRAQLIATLFSLIKMKITNKHITLLFIMSLIYGCGVNVKLKEDDKIFHAGPNMSGFGATFFGLYKNNIYEFCDGDFMDPGCYTGEYELNGNILTLKDLRLNDHVKHNRFIIFRYAEQDSTYWLEKYPNSVFDWKELRQNDINSSSEGDVYELDYNDKPVTNVNYYYVIRLDKLK